MLVYDKQHIEYTEDVFIDSLLRIGPSEFTEPGSNTWKELQRLRLEMLNARSDHEKLIALKPQHKNAYDDQLKKFISYVEKEAQQLLPHLFLRES